MSWAKLDDKLYSRAETLMAGNEAIGLWARCESYAADHETDGHLSAEIVELLSGSRANARRLGDRLVSTGFWTKTPTGYLSVGYLDRNPSHTDLDQRRAAEAQKKRAYRERHGRGPGSVPKGQEPDTQARPQDVPPGQVTDSPRDSLGESGECPAGSPDTPVPDPYPSPLLTPSPAHTPARTGARTEARAREAPALEWPSDTHKASAVRYLAELEARAPDKASGLTLTELAIVASGHADTFSLAVSQAIAAGARWGGWAAGTTGWLVTECGKVRSRLERAKAGAVPAAPSKAPPARADRGPEKGLGHVVDSERGRFRSAVLARRPRERSAVWDHIAQRIDEGDDDAYDIAETLDAELLELLEREVETDQASRDECERFVTEGLNRRGGRPTESARRETAAYLRAEWLRARAKIPCMVALLNGET